MSTNTKSSPFDPLGQRRRVSTLPAKDTRPAMPPVSIEEEMRLRHESFALSGSIEAELPIKR